jgi:hypothetical protein
MPGLKNGKKSPYEGTVINPLLFFLKKSKKIPHLKASPRGIEGVSISLSI